MELVPTSGVYCETLTLAMAKQQTSPGTCTGDTGQVSGVWGKDSQHVHGQRYGQALSFISGSQPFRRLSELWGPFNGK